jgi:hypothetical protein
MRSLARKIIASSLSIVAMACTAQAGVNQFSIGLKFGTDSTGGLIGSRTVTTLAPADVAGLPAVAQQNWNNLTGATGSNPAIVDNNGNSLATVGLTWNAPGLWANGNNGAALLPGTPDNVLQYTYLDNSSPGWTTVAITNLPSQLTTSGYDVYIYTLGDTGGRGGAYGIVDPVNTNTILGAFKNFVEDAVPTNYVQCLNVGAGTNAQGNYVVFHGLTAANIMVQSTTTINAQSGTPRAPICGIQLVSAPSPGEAGSATGFNMATNGLTGQMAISFTPGSASSGTLVVMRKNAPVTAEPVDGVTYTADTTLGLGSDLGDDEVGNRNIVVYNGSGSSVTVSNLIPTVRYWATAYSFNTTGANPNYTLATPASSNLVAQGNVTNLVLAAPTPVVVGSARHFQVIAQYDNGQTLDVASSATVTSSNTAIVNIQSAGRLGAVAVGGPVGLLATYTNAVLGNIIVATVTVTNSTGTTNGQTITVNGNTRTWTDNVVDATTQIQTTNSIGAAATNLFNHVSANPFAGLTAARSGTTGITLPTALNGSVNVSLSPGWGSVTYATNKVFMTASALVTVGNLSMTHEYSFNGGFLSLVVTDSVAGPAGYGNVITSDGTSGMNGSGQVTLSGSGNGVGSAVTNWVVLPQNLLTNYGAVTVEMWATENAQVTWERLFDFGNNTTFYTFMSAEAGGNIYRTAATTNGGGAETQVNFPMQSIAGSGEHQFVFTMAGASRTAYLFLDGVIVGVNTNFLRTPEDIGATAFDLLGGSQYALDGSFNGTMNEVRIYNGALDPFQIALDSITGPDGITNSGTQGALTSLSVTAGSPVLQFQQEQVTVTGVFANVSSPVPLTTAQQTTYTSQNANVFLVSSLGVISATGPGTANLIVSSFGTSKTNAITVTPIPPGMTHRWSFNGDFTDSVGGYTATPHGNAGSDGAQVLLDGTGAANGTTGTYVDLGANLFLGYSSAAVEIWYTDNDGQSTATGNRNWARIWDFGSFGGNNMWLCPFPGGLPFTMRFALDTNNVGEWRVNCLRPSTNVEHHAVVVVDGTNHLAQIWVDGALTGQTLNFFDRPMDMGPTPNDWIGRSQYGDPLFVGSINEFRIYNGIIDPLQIAIDYVKGPNTVLNENNKGALSSVQLSLNPAVTSGNQQTAQLLASFANVANVPVNLVSSNWTSSDMTIATVDKYGNLTAAAAGTATISATYGGITASSNVTVTAAAPLLANRYSFATDASDSVGGQNGTIINGTNPIVFLNGLAYLGDGANDSWIQLPGHLFDTNNEVTLETWLVLSNNFASSARIFDFCNSANGQLFAFSSSASGNNWLAFRAALPDIGGANGTTAGYTPIYASWGGQPRNVTEHHVVVVVSDIRGRVDLYMDGNLADSIPYNGQVQPSDRTSDNLNSPPILSSLFNNMSESYLAHSVVSAQNGFNGGLDEFRIWKGAMNKLQVETSYANGPGAPSINPGTLNTLNFNVNDPTMVVGTISKPTISGAFSGVSSNLDLTDVPGISYTSDASGVVAVINPGTPKFQALSVGTAHITASYGGKSVTKAVSVIAKPALKLTHQYTFNGNALDSIGNATALLMGDATNSNGRVVLDGNNNPPTYVKLPADLISGYDLVTFEMFYSMIAADSGSQQRLWDFGNHDFLSLGLAGSSYTYYAGGRGASGMVIGSGGGSTFFELGDATVPATDRAAFTTNVNHVVETIDSVNHILTIYTNGVYGASVTNAAVDLALVWDNFSNLGRSQWSDPHMNGSIDEFRLYYGVMSPNQVAASFAASTGQPVLKVTEGPGAGQVTVSWPAAPLLAGYSLQMTTALNPPVNWVAAGSPTVVGNLNQVVVNTTNAATFFRLIQ